MRLRSTRLLNVVVAALLAVLAAALTLAYTSRAQSKDTTSAKPTSVLVATRDIPVGSTAAQIRGWARPTDIAAGDVVGDAVAEPAQLRGLVAIQKIYAGEQLTTRRLGTAERQGIRSTLTGTLRIVELAGDQHQLLSGTLRPGDHVDVVASFQNPESSATHYARVVLRNLLVVDTSSGSGGTLQGGASSAAVDLQLTDEQAQRLFWVEKNGEWTLALRPVEKTAATNAPATSSSTLMGATRGR